MGLGGDMQSASGRTTVSAKRVGSSPGSFAALASSSSPASIIGIASPSRRSWHKGQIDPPAMASGSARPRDTV